MRHTLAPGTGDPEHFDLSDCASQRNLSQAGRNQAQQTGEKLRAKGYSDARVITSQWCRCKETAQLLALGEPEQLASLNSFFQNWEMKQEATNKTKAWIAKELKTKADGEVIVLVTHQVNITALTGHFPRSGEMVVAQQKPNGDLRHVASIDPR
jgi:broad specificity phosphatase PhoE